MEYLAVPLHELADSSDPIEIELREGPLPVTESPRPTGAGAVLTFEGVVRPLEDGRPLAALRYEIYEPMTQQELRRLAERAVAEHGLTLFCMQHSFGSVAVGEVSFRLVVAAPHRAEAIAAVDGFVSEMKRRAPIWKTPVFRLESDS